MLDSSASPPSVDQDATSGIMHVQQEAAFPAASPTASFVASPVISCEAPARQEDVVPADMALGSAQPGSALNPMAAPWQPPPSIPSPPPLEASSSPADGSIASEVSTEAESEPDTLSDQAAAVDSLPLPVTQQGSSFAAVPASPQSVLLAHEAVQEADDATHPSSLSSSSLSTASPVGSASPTQPLECSEQLSPSSSPAAPPQPGAATDDSMLLAERSDSAEPAVPSGGNLESESQVQPAATQASGLTAHLSSQQGAVELFATPQASSLAPLAATSDSPAQGSNISPQTGFGTTTDLAEHSAEATTAEQSSAAPADLDQEPDHVEGDHAAIVHPAAVVSEAQVSMRKQHLSGILPKYSHSVVWMVAAHMSGAVCSPCIVGGDHHLQVQLVRLVTLLSGH